MAMTAVEMKPKPSGLWYLAVLVLWVASFVVFFVLLIPVFKILTSPLTIVSSGDSVTVPSDGITVYTSVDDPTQRCALIGAAGTPVALQPFSSQSNQTFSLNVSGTQVWALASTPDNFPPGTYTLRCRVHPQSEIAWGKRVDFVEVGGRFLISIGVSGILGLAGLILLIVLLVKRHNSKNRIRIAQASAGYQYSYQYGAASPYQSQGYPQQSSYPDSSGYPQQSYPDSGGYAQPSNYPPPPSSSPPPSNYPPPPSSYPEPTSYPPPGQQPAGTPPDEQGGAESPDDDGTDGSPGGNRYNDPR